MALHLHFDPVGGAAGDMFIAAMLHAMPELQERVFSDLAKIIPPDVGEPVFAEHVISGIAARRFELRLHPDADGKRHGRETTYREMRSMLESASLSKGTVRHACEILHRIAEAEAQVHDIDIDKVHFHEIADWDALMDVTAAGSICAAIEGASVSLSSLPLGGGLVDTAHGKLPVPAPATALILKGYDWHDDSVFGERVTPTGAAILAHATCGSHGERPPGRLVSTGYGAGSRDLTGMPNVLRVTVFETEDVASTKYTFDRDHVTQLACDIDDMTGEELGFAVDRLRSDNAVKDLVVFQGVGKKSRPVTRIEILVSPNDAERVAGLCFDLTTTLGIRCIELERMILPRQSLQTDLGTRIKRTQRPGGETVKVESDDLQDAGSLAERRQRAGKAFEA